MFREPLRTKLQLFGRLPDDDLHESTQLLQDMLAVLRESAVGAHRAWIPFLGGVVEKLMNAWEPRSILCR